MLKKITQLFLLFMAFSAVMQAQVTTGSITGTVKTSKGENVSGATVTAILEASGTVFTTSTTNVGRFNFPNLPPGGPYTLKVTHVGYAELLKSDVYVALGDRYEANLTISVEGQTLEAVQVTSASRKSGAEKTGASTNINKRQIASTPNLDRSLMGLSKLTPQANGNNFMGVSTKFNNITVDGSIFNNNFGLSGGGIPGGAGGAQPISIDAVDMIQINLAPYDVRQAGFTGGGVNAVTKRGTNTFSGTVYDYFRPESFNGSRVKDQKLTLDKTSKNTFGFNIGGPIIKNKLFFFGNFETEKRTSPGQQNVALRPGVNDRDPNVTPTLASDMDLMKDFLKTNYKYDAGAYDGYNFHLDATKFLARVDWTISDKHRLTVRYNQSEAGNDVLVSATNYPIGSPALGGSRRGGKDNGLAFANSNYVQNNNVYSAVMELNSTFNDKLSNQLLASYTYQNDFRTTPNDQFLPFVDIMNGSKIYMSFGTEPYTYKNFLKNKTYNVSDNVTYNLGKHTLTGGVSFDYMKFSNSYGDVSSAGYYRYASMNDFMTGKAPTVYALTYGTTKGIDMAPSEATFAQFGVYAQDMFAVTDNLKVTYGVRLDLPYYPQSAAENPALKALTFKDQNYNNVNFDVSKWPKASALVSPRIGFTYDVMNDKSFVVRGGTGVFTGRIPFVWLVNQVTDNGVLNAKVTTTDPTVLADRLYNTNRNAYIPDPLPVVGTTIPNGSKYSATDPDFKMPQVWRSSLAIDKQIYKTWGITLEAIYSKTLNTPYTYNANAGTADVRKLAGADSRPYLTAPSYPVGTLSSMAVMTNSSKGYNYALTAQINKRLSDGFEGSLSYTYSMAKDVNSANSDVASSSINTNSIIQDPRVAQLGYSAFAMPHRIMANISYKIEYAKQMLATTIGVYYSGSAQDRYLYKYGFDINNDGFNGNDMMYIPKDASEITFVTNSITRPDKSVDVYTPQQQSDAFIKFIENDKYLRTHKGQYVDRYAALLPWIHSLDLRLLQDFKLKVNNKTHGFQFSVDITNALNMFNKNWGYRYRYNVGTYSDMAILNGSVNQTTMQPTYRFDPTITKGYDVNYGASSTWGMQMGIRYNFN